MWAWFTHHADVVVVGCAANGQPGHTALRRARQQRRPRCTRRRAESHRQRDAVHTAHRRWPRARAHPLRRTELWYWRDDTQGVGRGGCATHTHTHPAGLLSAHAASLYTSNSCMSSLGGSTPAVGVWASEEEFKAELRKMKIKATQSGVARLTELALKDPRQDYKHVVGCLSHHLRKTRPQHRCACPPRAPSSPHRG
jgi:hypothetical protein